MTEQEILKEFIKMEKLDKYLIIYYALVGNLNCLNIFTYPKKATSLKDFIDQFLKKNKLGKTDFVINDVCKNSVKYTFQTAIQKINEMAGKGEIMIELLYHQNRRKK